MQLKYKDLTADEINYKFNKQYGIPPKPVQGSDEMDEDFQTREQAWQAIQQDKMMELLIDAKLAKPELESAKAGIKFPTVEKKWTTPHIRHILSTRKVFRIIMRQEFKHIMSIRHLP